MKLPAPNITAPTIVELKDLIYRLHGWKRKAGESQAKRIKELYTIRVDQKRNVYIAERKGGEA